MEIKKVIIWGHKLHSHTHSYIHAGFYKAFKYLNYDTYWFDNEDNLEEFDFSNSLVLTEGNVCEKLPFNGTCFYILHNVDSKYHKHLPSNNKLNLQVFINHCINRDIKHELPFHYYLEPPNNAIYFPWATDLLPYEIDENIKNLHSQETTDTITFIGMRIEPWNTFGELCESKGYIFDSYGGMFDTNSPYNKSFEENQQLIKESIISPALQNEWQVEQGYIPCRIFKNISYGKMGITNNKYVNELFDNKLIYDTNIETLVDKGLKFEQKEDKYDTIIELMKEVRDKHTYINRIDYIKWYMKKYLDIVF